MKRLLLIIAITGAVQSLIQAQNSVSIGTEEINEDAVLQLVSPGNDQGFLVPKLTTSQRQAMSLENDDEALLVFDSDMGLFFFWYSNTWIQLSTGSDADVDPSNEIQDLQLDGANLSITGNPEATVIDLSSYLNTDNQILDFNLGTNQLSIEDGNAVDLSSLVDDADADSTNEIINYGEVINNELLLAEGEDTIRIDVSGLEDTFSGWDLSGNAGTNPAVNYLGTSDNTDLSLRTGGIERMRFNASTGNIGIGVGIAQERLHVGGNIQANGNLQLLSGGIIDDDATYGGNGDDWIRLNGFIELKSNTDNYGIVLRDRDNTEYLGITQVNGYSYFTDNSTYINYFLRGNGGDAHVRYNLTTGRRITSGNGYDVVSGDQFEYTNTQTRYKMYTAASLVTEETKGIMYNGRYACQFNGDALVQLDLPDGVLITRVEVRVYDGDGSGFLNPDNNISAGVYCRFRNNDNMTYVVSPEISTNEDPGYTTLTFNLPGYNVVNRDYGYYVWLYFEEDSSDHRFCWVRVTYTVQRAD